MNIQNSPYLSAAQLHGSYSKPVNKQGVIPNGLSFEQVLKQTAQDSDDIKFSKHAINRLKERNITLSDEQLTRLKNGMSKASGKGIKEPLVLIDNLAFIVSTGNRTVITAVGQDNVQENIFTNIDGAVIN